MALRRMSGYETLCPLVLHLSCFVGSGCAERDGRRIECGASLPTARTHMEGTDTYSMCPWQRAWQVEDVAWPDVNDDLLLETVKVSMRVGGPSNSACATCNT